MLPVFVDTDTYVVITACLGTKIISADNGASKLSDISDLKNKF